MSLKTSKQTRFYLFTGTKSKPPLRFDGQERRITEFIHRKPAGFRPGNVTTLLNFEYLLDVLCLPQFENPV